MEHEQKSKQSSTNHQPLTTNRHPLWWYVATWFGAGTSRFAPGTMGSLAALPFAFVIQVTLGNFALLAASLLMFLAGWWASDQYLKHTPAAAGKPGDPGAIVADEVAGQWLILCVLYPTWQSYLVGFLIFRAFDVVKPWPVCVADRKLKGGLGVMADDMLAALFPMMVYLVLMIEAQALGAQNLLLPIVNFLGGSYVR